MSTPNTTSPEGFHLGAELARLADSEMANGSVPTLMNCVKLLVDGGTFYCHETPDVCAGFAALASPGQSKKGLATPWPFIDGHD